MLETLFTMANMDNGHLYQGQLSGLSHPGADMMFTIASGVEGEPRAQLALT